MNTEPPVPRVHPRGETRLDAVLDLVAFAAEPHPLPIALDELPARVADVLSSDVCSVYLLEGADLVMRGNVGFPPGALGEVRLGVGKGLTGLAVQTGRPVSVSYALDDVRNNVFPELGEERFPVFLAMPLPGHAGPVGAVVVQRAEREYTQDELSLLAALAGSIGAVVERARLVDGTRSPASTGTRRATLTGRGLVPGRALGVVCALRRPAVNRARAPARNVAEASRALEKAVLLVETALDVYARAAARTGLDARFLGMHRSILEDGRLRERTLELAEQHGLDYGLGQVAREATRTARLSRDSALGERAQEMSELIDALRVLAGLDAPLELPRDAVWIGDHLTVFDLVVTSRAQPSALVLSDRVADERGRVLAELFGVPAVADVPGLLRWALPGDVALVDANHGIVRLNPTRRERDEARASKKQGG